MTTTTTRHPCGCVSWFDLRRWRSTWLRMCPAHTAQQRRREKAG